MRVRSIVINDGYRIQFSLYRTAGRLAVFLGSRRASVTEGVLNRADARVVGKASGTSKRSKVA